MDKQKGDLRLDTLHFAKKGGDSGPSLLPRIWPRASFSNGSTFPPTTMKSCHPKTAPSRSPKGRSHPLDPNRLNWPSGYQLHAQSERSLTLRKKAESKNYTAQAYPPAIRLQSKEDFNSIVVQAKYDDDATRDATRESSFALSQPGIVEWKDMILHPLKDGKTELKVTFEGQTKIIPVEVRCSTERPISFNLDVMPVFMKAGCNTGSCHGSARGQDRFMLSLFGYDPKGDHFRITREEGTRALTWPFPRKVCLSKKPSKRSRTPVENCSRRTATLANLGWLAGDGAPQDPEDIAKPDRIDCFHRPPGRLRCLSTNDGACSLLGRHHP